MWGDERNVGEDETGGEESPDGDDSLEPTIPAHLDVVHSIEEMSESLEDPRSDRSVDEMKGREPDGAAQRFDEHGNGRRGKNGVY